MLLTHAADEMGRLAVANAFGRRRRRFDPGLVPSVVFTDPEVAYVGATEADLAGGPYRRAFLPWPEWTGPSSPAQPTDS